MNVLHLKYAVEIAKTKSISRAAENLFMGQPNLSRAIKELETKIGINIFERTRSGIVITTEGERFLEYARRIVMQVEELESMYEGEGIRQGVSVCVVNGICIDPLSEKLKGKGSFESGTNEEVINAVLNRKVNLGIVKYDIGKVEYCKQLLFEKGLEYLSIGSFGYQLIGDGSINTDFLEKEIRYEFSIVWRKEYNLTESDHGFIGFFN